MLDYTAIGTVIVSVLTASLPIGILFFLVEKLVSMFLNFVFPKKYSDF